jgi:cytochrome b561
MSERYDRIAIVLHWLIGVALIGQMTFGFLLDDIAPRNTPARGAVINLHKSFGIVLGVLIVARLIWRLRHPPPPWPVSMPIWQQKLALWTHRALYACMLLAPLAGFTASNFSKHGVKFFGIAMPPLGPDVPGVYKFLSGVHVAVGWTLAALIVVHAVAALKHLWWDHDAVFARMSPRNPRPAAGSAQPLQ